MSAEINHWLLSEEGPEEIDGDLLTSPGIFWLSDYGDGQGNVTYIYAQEETVEIILGEVIGRSMSDGKEFQSFKPIKNIAELQIGEKHSELVFNTEGNSVLIHVKNIGASVLNPIMN